MADEYSPSMSDAAVKARTGRNWSSWFDALDREKAASLDHKAIVALLSKQFGVPAWWRQMVAVEYERARGLRARHQTASGYSVAVSKTMSASVARLYDAAARDATRTQWFPKGRFDLASKTPNKYFRGAWNRTSRVEINFYAKGDGKSQLAVQISKLAHASDVEAQRRVWRPALRKLKTLIE